MASGFEVAQRRERDRAHFDGPAHVVDLLDRRLVGMNRVIDDQPEHVLVDRPDPRPPPVPQIDDSERGERPERFAHDGARNAELSREPGFGRDRIADAQALAADALVDRPHGAVDQPSFRSGLDCTRDRSIRPNQYDSFS